MNLRSATLVFWLLILFTVAGVIASSLLDEMGRDDTCLSGSRYRTGWGQVREHRSSGGGKSRHLSNVDGPAVLHAGVLEGSARHGESRRCEKLKSLAKGPRVVFNTMADGRSSCTTVQRRLKPSTPGCRPEDLRSALMKCRRHHCLQSRCLSLWKAFV